MVHTSYRAGAALSNPYSLSYETSMAQVSQIEEYQQSQWVEHFNGFMLKKTL